MNTNTDTYIYIYIYIYIYNIYIYNCYNPEEIQRFRGGTPFHMTSVPRFRAWHSGTQGGALGHGIGPPNPLVCAIEKCGESQCAISLCHTPNPMII